MRNHTSISVSHSSSQPPHLSSFLSLSSTHHAGCTHTHTDARYSARCAITCNHYTLHRTGGQCWNVTFYCVGFEGRKKIVVLQYTQLLLLVICGWNPIAGKMVQQLVRLDWDMKNMRYLWVQSWKVVSCQRTEAVKIRVRAPFYLCALWGSFFQMTIATIVHLCHVVASRASLLYCQTLWRGRGKGANTILVRKNRGGGDQEIFCFIGS